ncbi:MAG: hypothetical protein AAFQ36_08930 [Pseudomonadota bacterium]
MEPLTDAILIIATLCAALYCFVLAARLRRFMTLDTGIGAAIAALSRQVDGMQKSLASAKQISGSQADELRDMTARAEIAAGRLELLLAAVHERQSTPAGSAKPAIDPRASLVTSLREMKQSFR